jgi:hypothetical protein
MARPPRTTVNCSHDRNVRSLAKKTASAHALIGRGTFGFDADGEGNSCACKSISIDGMGIVYRDGFGGGVGKTW